MHILTVTKCRGFHTGYGCGLGVRTGHPLSRRLVVWSPAFSVNMLKSPWARYKILKQSEEQMYVVEFCWFLLILGRNKYKPDPNLNTKPDRAPPMVACRCKMIATAASGSGQSHIFNPVSLYRAVCTADLCSLHTITINTITSFQFSEVINTWTGLKLTLFDSLKSLWDT